MVNAEGPVRKLPSIEISPKAGPFPKLYVKVFNWLNLTSGLVEYVSTTSSMAVVGRFPLPEVGVSEMMRSRTGPLLLLKLGKLMAIS